MKFYSLEPEVAGSLGPGTVMDTAVHPPRVHKLHYESDGWSGDDILEPISLQNSLKRSLRHQSLRDADLIMLKLRNRNNSVSCIRQGKFRNFIGSEYTAKQVLMILAYPMIICWLFRSVFCC